MSRHCVSVLLLVCIAQACLAFVPSWTATSRSSRSQPPASTPAAATFSLSQPSGAICPVFGAWGACGAHTFYPVRGITSLSAMSEGDEEEGGGDHDAREAADGSLAADEIRAVQDEIRGVERKIEGAEEETAEVVKKIDGIEAAIAGGSRYLGMTDPEALLKQLGRKEDEKEQLRREKEQLRELLLKKEDRLSRIEQLRANNAPAGAVFQPGVVFQPANKTVSDFAAALTGAVVTEDTLELANGTFFLGDTDLGDKLFIRPCYRELSEIILGGASSGALRNIVVTGTPGIGKSMFGFHLLHLLRCEGKTVVFELKGEWYRFSDEGVITGLFPQMFAAGYLKDDSCWYLSDPELRPYERFAGVTVVLVSPKEDRVKEFIKQKTKSRKLYMPVWDLDELLECRQAVFPGVPLTDVKRAFGAVGGVARAVFGSMKLQQLIDKMENSARKMDLVALREVLTCIHGDNEGVLTDKTGDSLLHMLPLLPDRAFEYFIVDFASDYARELAAKALPQKEARALAGLVGAGFADEVLHQKIGGSVLGVGFEEVAHNAIRGIGNIKGSDGQTFHMKVLSNCSIKILEGRDHLKFGFTEMETFTTKTLRKASDGGYYRPKSKRFAAVDAFGVQGDTLYFFQMKSKGVEVVLGGKVETYWDAALASKDMSVKKCVFVYAVPDGGKWQKASTMKKGRDWLEGASDGFKSKCPICAIRIRFISW